MSFVHCMVCFVFPSANTKFYITSCGHIACFNCINNGCWSLRCKICQKENIRVIEINRSIPAELSDMFTSMADGIDKMGKDVNMHLDFQAGHRNKLIQNLQHKADTLSKLENFCQGEMKKKEQYKQQLLKMQEFKKRSEKEFSQLKTQLVKEKATVQALKTKSAVTAGDTTMNLANLTHDPFRTPAVGNKNNRSFVTSTPYLPRSSIEIDQSNVTMNSTMGNMSGANNSLSFSAATGLPKSNHDNSTDISRLGFAAEAISLSSLPAKSPAPAKTQAAPTVTTTASGGKKRCSSGDKQTDPKSRTASSTQGAYVRTSTQQTFKTPTKKTKLDMMSKTMPLPLK